MKGSRELKNMKDTPSFKHKKVLALSKLRHSNSTGRKQTVPSTSTKLAKKHKSEKTKSSAGEKTASAVPTVEKRKGRPPKQKKEDKSVTPDAPSVDIKKEDEQKIDAVEDETPSERKVGKSETVTEQAPGSLGRKKFVKKQMKTKTGLKPERKLRSQFGGMLMRHGKKVTKAPVPKRKRTLSADFELLDERSLKKTLKESAETDTDHDSDASTTEDKMTKNLKKKNVSSKYIVQETSNLDSSWVDCPSPLVDSGKKSSKRSKNVANSRDSSLDGQEAGIILKRQGVKQTTIRKQVDAKRPNAEKNLSADAGNEEPKKPEGDDKPKKRGRPPKRKRKSSVGEQITDGVKSPEKNDTQIQPVLPKPITKEISRDTPEIKFKEGTVGGKKQRLSLDENPHDPYSFSGMDFEEEVDHEISFKPSGISGEVKRKPGRPKHGAARQPAVKALKVKSTHKLLISDQKSRPFSRVRGGRILKASQIYRGNDRKRRLHPLHTKSSVIQENMTTQQDNTEEAADKTFSVEEKPLPVIAPLKIEIAEHESEVASPMSPDIQHPDLTIIKDLISPAPSNDDDLEPPILELANIDACETQTQQRAEENVFTEDNIGPAILDNEQMVAENSEPGKHETYVKDSDNLDNDVSEIQVESSTEVPEVQETNILENVDGENSLNLEECTPTLSGNEMVSDHEGENLHTEETVHPNSKTDTIETELEVIVETSDTAVHSQLSPKEVCSGSEESAESSKMDTICGTEVDKIEIDFQESGSDVQKSNVKDLDSSEVESDVKSEEIKTDEPVTNMEEPLVKVEEALEEVVENCIKYLLDTVDDMIHSQISMTTAAADTINDVCMSDDHMDGICESDAKEKDHKYEVGGIKMKLKRHKGKFKVTRLSEEDESLLSDVEDHPEMDENNSMKVDKDLIKQDDVTLVMNSILDEIDSVFDDCKEDTDDKSPNVPSETKICENDVFSEGTDLESANSSSCSEASPTDSEKRVPPLTIRLNKKPVRQFELRPKVSRSPIEIIAMRQKRYEEEYDKNEATRLAKKLEKQTVKRKNLMKTSLKDVNVAETGLVNAEKAGNIGDLLDLCTPCSVSVIDFVKQLNLQPDEEESQKGTVTEESDTGENNNIESPQVLVSENQKKRSKTGKKSQFKSGRPRGRPPKLKNKLPTATAGQAVQPLKKPEETCQTETTAVEKDAVEELSEVGFVGSFVEFLKSKKKEKSKIVKLPEASKGVKKIECKSDQSKTNTSVVESPTATNTGTSMTAPTETAKTKHLSGDSQSGVRYVCNKCEFSSGFEKTMVFHIYRHIPGVSFKCGYCNKDFQSMVAASAHSKNEHHGKESRIIKSKDLNESELYHVVEEAPKIDATSVKSLEPGQTGSGAAPGQVIISFLVGSNLLKTTKRFVCTHCEYSTDILEDVQQHCKDLHTTDDMFACILCADAYFSSEETVKNHNHSTHPTRPQSYRKLPSFYDIEQMKAAEKSQLEDRGNIFDRMNNLFSTSTMGDESGSENPRKAHYQRARDFLYVQEGWKNKTSAEADSTTILDNESISSAGHNTIAQEQDIVGTTGDGSNTQEKESVVITDHNSTAATEKESVSDTDSTPVIQESFSLASEKSEEITKTDLVAIPSTDVEEKKMDEIQGESNIQAENDVKEATESSSPPPDSVDAAPAADLNKSISFEETEKEIAQQSQTAVAAVPESKSEGDSKNDDSGVSNLKIIDVVSLRDQNQEQDSEATKKKVSTRSTNSSRASSNLPEVDVDALVLRNERITCTYKCMKCNIHSPYLSAMVEHLKHYHSEITLFTCPYCRGYNSQKPEFASEVNVHEHVKKVHPSNCAKNEVSLSDTAKTFVQVLAIPSGIECNKVGNTFVIEKDIYMCLKCQAHMPSLDYTFGHLEREHPDAFVHVCPLCKTFKDKSDEVVFGHIMKEHKQDPNDHPLSVAIEDNLFVRIPSISKSGAYNDRVNPSKLVKSDSHRKILPKSPSSLSRNDDSEDDVLVVGETKNLSRPSTIRTTGSLTKRGRPPLISQGSGSITTSPRISQKSPVRFATPERSGTLQQLQARALLGAAARFSPKSKTISLLKPSTEQSQELMMDCENIDDPVNTLTDVVEDDGDVEVPVVTTSTTLASMGSIIDSSTVISHSAAVAVASSVVSVATPVPMTTSPPSVTLSSTSTALSKQVGSTHPVPPPLKKFGASSDNVSKPDVPQLSSVVTEASKQNTTPTSQQTSGSLPQRSIVAEKLKEMQISRPKSSLFSMTDKLNRLHARAAEREREKERAAQERNSPLDTRSSPQSARDSPFGTRSSPLTNTSSPVLSSGKAFIPTTRPVLKVPTYTSIPRGPQRQINVAPTNPISMNPTVHQNLTASAQAQRKSLLFRNCPLDLSRTPSPATTPGSSNSLPVNPTVSAPSQSRSVTDDLPPDAFKIFNLKPDSRRPKPTQSAPSTVPTATPVTQILGNTIPNIVGTLAPPGTLLQQVQALPYTQLAQMQMAGVPLNPVQLQGLCIPGPGNSFVLANIPQQLGARPNVPSQQIPQMHVRPGTATSIATVPLLQGPRLSNARTVAQALAERSQSNRPVLPQPRAASKQHIPPQSLLPMNKSSSQRMAQQDYYCPYCSQFRPLREYEVKPHIERCHPGKDVLFFKLSS